jgi:hypothetical protein
MKFCLLLLLLTATATITNAQEFGGNPPSIKWKQVNTPAAKVIFPVGMDSAAMRVANIVEQMNRRIQPTIGFKQKQISIVFQNQTTISNAYVGLAPFRSEFFMTPDQNSFEIGSLYWPGQLAIHEFRHVQQYNNFNVGVSHALRFLFGEGGQALGNDLAIPNWFFEGDAVYNETLVSEQGRGRLPFFLNGYRALWAAGKNYSYMKLRNGSYSDYIPDWYPLGYMLVAYGREKYGDDFWKKVTQNAAAFKGGFYPMQKAIKKYSGQDFVHFRNDGLNYFKKQLNHGAAKDSAASQPKHFVSDREYPVYANDSTLIYLKSTYDHLPVFVIKTGDKEKDISVRDISIDNYFSYRDGKIVYSAYRPDVRWGYRNYSEVVVLDAATGEEQRLTKNTKYFSPAFSDDGRSIIVVDEPASGKNALSLINTADGTLVSNIPNPQNLFYTYPKFYGNDRVVSAVRNPAGKMSLALIDIKDGQTKYLLPFSYQPIVFPVVKKDTVYFSATSGYDDGLYALSIATGKLSWLSNYYYSGAIGYYQPAISDKKLAWVGFTAAGYKINEADRASLRWLVMTDGKLPGTLPDFEIAALKRDSAADILDKIKNEPLAVSKYPKSYHLLNFHSLIPNFNDPNYQLSIAGENVLNTFQSELSFTYNRDEGYKQIGFDAIYGALFPYLSAGADYTIDRKGYHNGVNIYWNETRVHGGFQVPLNFTRGKHLTSLRIGTDVFYSKTNFQPTFHSLFADRSYTYLNHYLVFSSHIQQARQNIYPRFGQSISLNYKSTITGPGANQLLAAGALYLPGLAVNHNLVITAAHQQRDKGNVISFSNDFPFSRGYTAENLYDMNKIGANYHFPIAYPDAGIGNAIYLLRLRANVFYDYTKATDYFTNGKQFRSNFCSTGAELFFDTKVFNQGSITFGIRYSYLIDRDIFGGNGRNRIELVVPVAFF